MSTSSSPTFQASLRITARTCAGASHVSGQRFQRCTSHRYNLASVAAFRTVPRNRFPCLSFRVTLSGCLSARYKGLSARYKGLSARYKGLSARYKGLSARYKGRAVLCARALKVAPCTAPPRPHPRLDAPYIGRSSASLPHPTAQQNPTFYVAQPHSELYAAQPHPTLYAA